MALTKKKIIEAVEAMPQEEFVSAEEVIEEIILLEKIEEGMRYLAEGKVITHEELEKEIRS